jgi:hypothetical protein
MIMRKAAAFALALAFTLAALPAARAAEPVPTDHPALEKRLASYDPAAVTAARHYYASPARKAGLVRIFDNVQKHLLGDLAKQNPGLNKDQIAKTMSIANDAMKDRLDVLTDMSMVVALDTLTTSELVALDQFYSSPEGLSIVAKMPQIGAQMPTILQSVMPDYVNEIKTQLKASNPELKL